MVGNAPVHKEEMKEEEHWTCGRSVQKDHHIGHMQNEISMFF